MIQVTPQMRILLAVEPVDFRKGIDGLASVCKNVLGSDPFCGYMFVFMNKKKTAIKILVYDGQGFWLCQKRLSKGRFCWWPDKRESPMMRVLVYELQLVIWNGNPKSARAAPVWKKIASQKISPAFHGCPCYARHHGAANQIQRPAGHPRGCGVYQAADCRQCR